MRKVDVEAMATRLTSPTSLGMRPDQRPNTPFSEMMLQSPL
jgi:hypothetical protein